MDEATTVGPRPPVALGCTLFAAVVIGVAVLLGTCVVFLESGANTGEVTLKHVDAYPPGSLDFVGEHNFYVVRTRSGEVLALSDLDAANRVNPARRCRVHPASVDDPAVTEAVENVSGRVSPAGRGTALVFTEDCNGAVYDIGGVRLDRDGPNLDRFETHLNEANRVVADLRQRQCTRREGDILRAAVACAEQPDG